MHSIRYEDYSCTTVVNSVWKCADCSTRHSDTKKRNKSYQRFYVFTWTLGAIFNTATAIYGFSIHSNKSSNFLLWLSFIASFVTAISHVYITGQKHTCARRAWILYRFISSIAGVAIVACMVAVGTFTVNDTPGLFIFFGLASIACYTLAGIGLSRRLYWECKKCFSDPHSDVTEERRNPRGTSPIQSTHFDSPDNLAIIYNEYDGRMEMIRTVQPISRPSQTFVMTNNLNGRHNHINNNIVWGISPISLPLLTLPTYDDAISGTEQMMAYQPPKYVEHSARDVLQEELRISGEGDSSVTDSEQLDSPPEYQENIH